MGGGVRQVSGIMGVRVVLSEQTTIIGFIHENEGAYET